MFMNSMQQIFCASGVHCVAFDAVHTAVKYHHVFRQYQDVGAHEHGAVEKFSGEGELLGGSGLDYSLWIVRPLAYSLV